MQPCPFCSSPLPRQVSHGEIYWFCGHCRTEIPSMANLTLDERMTSSRSVILSEKRI